MPVRPPAEAADARPPVLALGTGKQHATLKPGFAPRVIEGGQPDFEDAIGTCLDAGTPSMLRTWNEAGQAARLG